MCGKLNRVTIEEYIIANGGLSQFLEGLLDFSKENGFYWRDELKRMSDDVHDRARKVYNLLP